MRIGGADMINKIAVLKKHMEKKGKIEIIGKAEIKNKEDLSTYYTPGVAYVSEAIKKNKELAYEYTNKANTIAIISDGTRILGLGNIGPEAGLPVMEGKSMLFKKYAGVDAIPICLGTTDENEIIKIIKALEPSIAGVNIEDIESPKSFRIIKETSRITEIPIFHDDQYGTAVVTLAALNNALKLARKGKNSKIIIFGSGSAGYGITKLLSFAGYKKLYVFDSKGIIKKGRKTDMNEFKNELAAITNLENKELTINEAVNGADVIIGVSGKKGYFKKDWIKKMNKKSIVFALSNPDPEITYDDALKAGAFIAATGKSNSPNQVNNIIAFPGIIRGLLEVRAKTVNLHMLMKAAEVISKMTEDNLAIDRIIPSALDEKTISDLVVKMAVAVGTTAIKSNNARIKLTPFQIKTNSERAIKHYQRIENLLF